MPGLMDFLRNYTDTTGDHALGEYVRSSPGYQQANMQGPPEKYSKEGMDMAEHKRLTELQSTLSKMPNDRLLQEYNLYADQYNRTPSGVNSQMLLKPLQVLQNELSRRGLIKGMQPQE